MIEATTELSAVNTMLATIGEAPVNTLEDSGNAEASMARSTLHNVAREIQSRAWHFNSEEVTLHPNEDGEIYVSADFLRVVPVDQKDHRSITVRGNKLYNRNNNSFSFDGSLKVKVTMRLGFDEMPEVARIYATIRASRVFQHQVLGSQVLSAFSEMDELSARALLEEYEGDTADYNVLSDSYSVARVLVR